MTIEKFKRFVLLVALLLGVVALPTAPVNAINVIKDKTVCTAGTQKTSVCADKDETINDTVSTLVNVLLFAIGIVSVIMIIVGGLRYVTSNGDASKVTAAKNTVLYSVIGLVVALLAFAIVNFVVAQFG